MHCDEDPQVRVHRCTPPGRIERQTSGEAHSLSEPHSSSSCFDPGPPVVLLALVEEEDDVVVTPELELVEAPCPLLLLEELVLPPMPLLLLVLDPGTHWALTLQM
jgi:hypothetical protein